MAENSHSATSTRKKFYSIDGEGRLFRKATPDEAASNGRDIVRHEKQKGEKKGEIEVRKVFKDIDGIITSMWVKSSEFGDSLIVELYDDGTTFSIQMPLDSNFSDDVMRKANNLEVGKKYVFQSWKMQATDPKTNKAIPEKFVRGMSIKDVTGNKVEKYVDKERQLSILPLSKAPFYEATAEYQSKDFWKIYFKMLTKEFVDRLVPYNKKRFEEWAEKNVSTSDYVGQAQKTEYGDNWMNEPQPITTEPSAFHDSDESNSFPSLADEPPIIDNELPF